MVIGKELRITIASIGEAGIGLSKEIDMIKSALLYGDKLTLISPLASLYLPMDSFASASIDEKLRVFFAMSHAAGIGNRDVQSSYNRYIALRSKKRKTGKEQIDYEKHLHYLTKAFSNTELFEKAKIVANEAGAHHIRRAISEGMLDVELLETRSDSLADAYMSSVLGSILAQETFPMFDKKTSNLIDSFFQIQSSFVSPDRMIKRSKQVQLNNALLSGLPNFTHATVDEILDIRTELQTYLIRYRSSIMLFADEIQSVPWTKNFENDIEHIYRMHVQPAIEDIKCMVDSNSEMSRLSRMLNESKFLWSSGIALVAFLFGDGEYAPLLSTSTVAAVGGSILANLNKVRNERKEINNTIQKLPLYYLFKAEQLVAK